MNKAIRKGDAECIITAGMKEKAPKANNSKPKIIPRL